MVIRSSRDLEEHDEVIGQHLRFYALNGVSVVDFLPHSKKEDIHFLPQTIRKANPVGQIILILDNFRSHKENATMVQAARLEIDLIFLPPYSPDLNPIVYIWKSVKRVISDKFVKSLEDMRMIISRSCRIVLWGCPLPDLGSPKS